jgi:hypothetical protein
VLTGSIALPLGQHGLMDEGESLHGSAIVSASRSRSVSHPQELWIDGFEVADGLPREVFATCPIDPVDDRVANFDGDARQWVKFGDAEGSTRFRGKEPVEHAKFGHQPVRFAATSSPSGCHIEYFGVVPAEIRLDLSHADVWSEVVEFPRYPFSGQFRDTWQYAHRSRFLLPKAPVQGHVP